MKPNANGGKTDSQPSPNHICMPETVLYYIIITILVVQFAVDTVLKILNARRFNEPLPAEVSDLMTPEEYEKATAYKRINFRFGMVSSTFSTALTLGFLIFGGFEWIDQISRGITSDPLWLALVYFGIIFLGSDLIQLPFAYYQTFVIEERFGFNKTTLRTFVTDRIKGWVMAVLLGGVLLSRVMLFYRWAGSDFWWYAWVLIALFTVFMNFFYSKLIVPLFNKQTPLEDGSLKEKIESYAAKVGFELEQIYVIDGSRRSTKANAYFSGFGKQKRVTLYDTLINDLEEEEIVAVLAHEVGHFKKKHIIYNLIATLLVTGVTLFVLSLFINNPELSLAIGVSQPSFHAALISFGLLYSPISEITGLLMNHLSRKFEYQADRWAKTTWNAHDLISSLKKLSKHSLSNLTPHPAYVFAYYSHPPLVRRIRALRA